MNLKREPRPRSTNIYIDKEALQNEREMMGLSENGAGMIEYSSYKNEIGPLLHNIQFANELKL